MNHAPPELFFNLPPCIEVEDCFAPESAKYVIDAIAGLDDGSCAVTLKLRAMDAERQRSNN